MMRNINCLEFISKQKVSRVLLYVAYRPVQKSSAIFPFSYGAMGRGGNGTVYIGEGQGEFSTLRLTWNTIFIIF